MLPAKRRIKKEFFLKIIKDGYFVYGDNFYLKLLAKNDQLPTLFAFVVPLKVKKTSVGRHLIKRKLSAVIENILPNIKSGFYIILFIKKDVISSSDYKKEIVDLLSKAQVLN